MDNGIDIRTLDVQGQAFDYIDIGEGAPVVFMHGALGDLRTFAPHCQRLADRYRAITYTQRYFGTGTWPENGPAFGIEAHAQDLVAFIEALAIGPVFLVAWSYSGHAALRAAQLRPDLIRAMFIYETGFQTFMTDPKDIEAFKTDLGALFTPVIAAVQAGNNVKAAAMLINGSAADHYYFDTQLPARKQIEVDNAHMVPRLLVQTQPPVISEADLRALTTPITLACGSISRPAYKLVSETAMRIVPGRHCMIPGATHFWPDSEPSSFTDFIGEWLDAQTSIETAA